MTFSTVLRRVLPLAAIPAVLVLSACNPINVLATQLQPDTWGAPAFYTGPPEAYAEVTVDGTWGYDLLVTAGVRDDAMKGPADRWCGNASGGIEPCAKTPQGVVTPDIFAIDGDPAEQNWVRTITLYEGEAVEVLVSCRNVFNGFIGCPAGTSVNIRTTTQSGQIIGDLQAANYG